MTRIFSDVALASTTWKVVGGEAELEAAGNVEESATVQVWLVPPAGASVPPLETAVMASLVKMARVTPG